LLHQLSQHGALSISSSVSWSVAPGGAQSLSRPVAFHAALLHTVRLVRWLPCQFTRSW